MFQFKMASASQIDPLDLEMNGSNKMVELSGLLLADLET